MMSTDDDDDTDLSTSDELSRPSNPLKDNTINQSSVVKSVQDLMFGANYVHTNYLDTWGMIMRRGKYLIPLAAFFFVAVAVLPNTTAHIVSEHLRNALERGLMLVHTTTAAILATLILLPYMIMRGIIDGSLRSLSDVTAATGRISHWVVSTPEPSGSLPLSLIVLVCPLVEELIFRWGFWRLWKLLPTEENKSDSDDGQSLSRWVIVSSVIFSAAHINNHLPVPGVDEVASIGEQLFDQNTKDWFLSFLFGFYEYILRYRPIISAMFQCQLAYVIGIIVTMPVVSKTRLLGGGRCSFCMECFCFVWLCEASISAAVN